MGNRPAGARRAGWAAGVGESWAAGRQVEELRSEALFPVEPAAWQEQAWQEQAWQEQEWQEQEWQEQEWQESEFREPARRLRMNRKAQKGLRAMRPLPSEPRFDLASDAL